jgi:hypothetical protein
MAPKRNVFLGKHFAELATSNINYKTNTHPWPHITTSVTGV